MKPSSSISGSTNDDSDVAVMSAPSNTVSFSLNIRKNPTIFPVGFSSLIHVISSLSAGSKPNISLAAIASCRPGSRVHEAGFLMRGPVTEFPESSNAVNVSVSLVVFRFTTAIPMLSRLSRAALASPVRRG